MDGCKNSSKEIALCWTKRSSPRPLFRSLPSSDRVMVVRVEGLPSPATGMEKNRDKIERAIRGTRPGASALNLDQAFLFADQIRGCTNSRRRNHLRGRSPGSESGSPG